MHALHVWRRPILKGSFSEAISPHEEVPPGGPIDRALVDAWTPVDQYTGGAEHPAHAPAVRPRVDEDDA